jgi:hypothetical protein
MVESDKYFVISSDEINGLYTLLAEEEMTSAIACLDFILSTKVMTIDSPYGGLIYFD